MCGVIWGKIIDRVASHNRKQPKHLGVLPWEGRLTKPWDSPKVTLGDVMEKAQVIPKKQLSSPIQPVPS
jgi:hypothetical protein